MENIAHDKLEILMHENNILRELITLKYTRASTEFKRIFL